MTDADLIDQLIALAQSGAMLSGAEREFIERVERDGFTDAESDTATACQQAGYEQGSLAEAVIGAMLQGQSKRELARAREILRNHA